MTRLRRRLRIAGVAFVLVLAVNSLMVLRHTGALWPVDLAVMLTCTGAAGFAVGYRRGIEDQAPIIESAIAQAFDDVFGWMPQSITLNHEEDRVTALVQTANGGLSAIELPAEVAESQEDAMVYVISELAREARPR